MRVALLATVFAMGFLVLGPSALAASAGHVTSSASAPIPQSANRFNQPGDLLITDQYNNRVIEINPLTKAIVWSFGSGNATLCNPGPHGVSGPNDAERLSGGLTLISGTGVPSGVPGTVACVDNRVFVVDQSGGIVWQYGVAGLTGSGFNRLNVPVFAIQLPNHHFLITDQGNNRIIEVNASKHVVWSYGPASGPGALNSPNSAELLRNGHILIADENNNRVIEINRAGHILWQYSAGILTAAFASRLANGDTLITDAGHNRVVEVSHNKTVVFQYFTNLTAGSNVTSSPTNAVRIGGGDVLITDELNNRVIVIDALKNVVFQYGKTNVIGHGFDELFGPYSAAEIGDYTGVTPPPAHFT
jgi:hypothetical protein